jgi:hypothetical protein
MEVRDSGSGVRFVYCTFERRFSDGGGEGSRQVLVRPATAEEVRAGGSGEHGRESH